MAIPIVLGVIHQFGALLLFTSQILYYFYSSTHIEQWDNINKEVSSHTA